jgi:tetratricopeptide (TPR) repeat protein
MAMWCGRGSRAMRRRRAGLVGLRPRELARVVGMAVCAMVGAIGSVGWVSEASAQGLLQSMRGGGAAQELPTPELAPGVAALLETAYLTEDEAANLRVRHGAWEEADLADPVRAGRAALLRGAIGDAALSNPAADPLDRAEAMVRRGEAAGAVEIASAQGDSWRARRVRAEALMALGRLGDAAKAIDAEPVPSAREDADALVRADEIVERARAMSLRLRLGAPRPGAEVAAAYQAILVELGDARERLDPMSPLGPLVEAELLIAHNAYAEGSEALEAVFTLNPRSARAYRLAGEAAVAGLDRARAEAIATRLDELAAPSVSLDAAAVRVGIRVRLGDAAGAVDAARVALAAYPSSVEARAIEAAAVARTFDESALARVLAGIEEIAPGSPEGYLAAGGAMSDARQYSEAATLLAEASRRAPAWAEPAVELGLTLTQAGRDQEAIDALSRAVELDPFNRRAQNSLTLLRELATYATHESEHFIVRCKPGVDEILAREMLPVLERIHARVTGAERGGIDHVPANKTVVELYPNHRWFAVRIVGMPGVHTIAAATGPLIAMEAPRLGPGHLVGPYDWARVVQHEYVHTVTLSRTKNRLPHWFTEASAVYLEDAPRDWMTVQLLAREFESGGLFDLDRINLGFVRPEKPTDRSLAYAQGHWMYEHMMERYGARKPLELMDLYAAGVAEAEAFERVLGVSREEFLEGFVSWAGEQLVAWGMRPAPGVATLSELIEREYGEDGPPSSGPSPEVVARWLEAHPEHPEVLRLAVMEGLPEDPSAVADASLAPLLERYARARPVDPMPHRVLARMYLASSEPSRAIAHLEFLDAREQNSTAYAEELARLHAAAGDWTRAMARSERATRISPYDARVREFGATIALRAGDLAAAERHVLALMALEPGQAIHQKRLDAIRARKR